MPHSGPPKPLAFADLKIKLLMKYFRLPKYIKNIIMATHVPPVPPKKSLHKELIEWKFPT